MQVVLPDIETRATFEIPGQPAEELLEGDQIAGEGPVEGFRLELGEIWQGV